MTHRILCVGILAVVACGGRAGSVRPYPGPTAEGIVAALTARNSAVHSFRAVSVMEYWVKDERMKGTVLVMGKRGRFIRFNAESPTGGNVLADMACDGEGFQYVNLQENCYMKGVCTRSSTARLLGIDLDPDELLLFAVGSTPLIDHASAAVEWDRSKGHEVVTLKGEAGIQTIELAYHRGTTWTVLRSRLVDSAGKTQWSIANKKFRDGKAGNVALRLPKGTQLKQPETKAELTVVWESVDVNPDLDDAKFRIKVPEGLPICR